jgi:hypothetical protein
MACSSQSLVSRRLLRCYMHQLFLQDACGLCPVMYLGVNALSKDGYCVLIRVSYIRTVKGARTYPGPCHQFSASDESYTTDDATPVLQSCCGTGWSVMATMRCWQRPSTTTSTATWAAAAPTTLFSGAGSPIRQSRQRVQQSAAAGVTSTRPSYQEPVSSSSGSRGPRGRSQTG